MTKLAIAVVQHVLSVVADRMWRVVQELTLEPTVMELLNDAGAEVKQKLGKNLDPYESADSTRIV
eukprot:COSAG02_NODE_6284_length_3679_cov_1.991620_3_plen_65_part_00